MTHTRPLAGRAALVSATLIWGVSFVLMDFALDSVPPLFLLAVRFSGAAAIMFLFGIRELKKLDKTYLLGGALTGLILLTAYVFQTYGLQRTTPGKNAFLTAIYCVIVPFMCWVTIKKKPDRYNVLAGLICIAGIGLISLGPDLRIGLGDGLTIICGFFFALHIIACGHFVGGRSPVLTAMVQFAAAGIAAWIGTLLLEPMPTAISFETGLYLAFLTVLSTALCLFLQIFGQKHTPAPQTAVIMTLEAVFGAAASVVFTGEPMTPKLLSGFLLTFAAIIISETKLSFFKKKKRLEAVR